jgi:hypothetical protein
MNIYGIQNISQYDEWLIKYQPKTKTSRKNLDAYIEYWNEWKRLNLPIMMPAQPSQPSQPVQTLTHNIPSQSSIPSAKAYESPRKKRPRSLTTVYYSELVKSLPSKKLNEPEKVEEPTRPINPNPTAYYSELVQAHPSYGRFQSNLNLSKVAEMMQNANQKTRALVKEINRRATAPGIYPRTPSGIFFEKAKDFQWLVSMKRLWR